jgi:hypothetical protein
MTITLTREEAQQVLDALELHWENPPIHVRETVETLRTKLTQPELKKALVIRGQKDKVVAIYREGDEEIIRAEMLHEEIFRTRLAHPEPEPVATVWVQAGDIQSQIRPGLPPGTKLYTAPPQREWVGIEDEEIRRTDHHRVDGAYDYSFKQGARWAEAKLKEKNT